MKKATQPANKATNRAAYAKSTQKKAPARKSPIEKAFQGSNMTTAQIQQLIDLEKEKMRETTVVFPVIPVNEGSMHVCVPGESFKKEYGRTTVHYIDEKDKSLGTVVHFTNAVVSDTSDAEQNGIENAAYLSIIDIMRTLNLQQRNTILKGVLGWHKDELQQRLSTHQIITETTARTLKELYEITASAFGNDSARACR